MSIGSPGHKMTSPPNILIIFCFSCDALNGTAKIDLYPLADAAIATAIAVLPPEASTIVPPGLRIPLYSAASIILTAALSLTLPPGFINSHLAYILHPVAFESDLISIIGVFPTAEVMSPTSNSFSASNLI
jgi:hypothetical protein